LYTSLSTSSNPENYRAFNLARFPAYATVPAIVPSCRSRRCTAHATTCRRQSETYAYNVYVRRIGISCKDATFEERFCKTRFFVRVIPTEFQRRNARSCHVKLPKPRRKTNAWISTGVLAGTWWSLTTARCRRATNTPRRVSYAPAFRDRFIIFRKTARYRSKNIRAPVTAIYYTVREITLRSIACTAFVR